MRAECPENETLFGISNRTFPFGFEGPALRSKFSNSFEKVISSDPAIYDLKADEFGLLSTKK
ncbi:hypothetical protein LEP1GSC165_0291 [Leptospira santarosai str. CBC523]|nr:hypothetical protein LEP1GSC165_0291 [Leptospira santarosai str. CBC523]